ncbi:MATH domain and TRAF-like domain-containing protein [Strongyloides ratti]|uniref:MATH domain and TRAF-like domain-containing protein n=1 Tax=Strongyloides ratti TaxID=34506 RepID=A0A090L0Z7_STRRB|nr:MATH domain and TRAF-like domain-containing protein [Strongyloides ratti]CEF63356.1 MATH domain and TRAF-like domain-containing protein [Strongyloides ratti]
MDDINLTVMPSKKKDSYSQVCLTLSQSQSKIIANASTIVKEESSKRKRSKLLYKEKVVTCDNENQTIIASSSSAVECNLMQNDITSKNMNFDVTSITIPIEEKDVDQDSLPMIPKENFCELKNCSPIDLNKPMYTNSVFMTVENMIDKEFDFETPPKYISGYQWKVSVERVVSSDKKSKEYLGLFVKLCNCQKKLNILVNSQLVLFTYSANKSNLIKKISYIYNYENTSYGYDDFISMEELIDPKNNYMLGGKIFLEVVIDVNEVITDKELEIKFEKYIAVIEKLLKKKKLHGASDVCQNIINCYSHLKSPYIEIFKRKLDEITVLLVNDTIERIEQFALNTMVVNRVPLKKELRLNRMCQLKRIIKSDQKKKVDVEENIKTENIDEKENKCDNIKVRGKMKDDSKKCTCKFKDPHLMLTSCCCTHIFDSKTFFYQSNNDKMFYYSVFGSRYCLNQLELKNDYRSTSPICSNSKIISVEKFLTKWRLFNCAIESQYSKTISCKNQNFERFILNIKKNKDDLRNIMTDALNVSLNKYKDNDFDHIKTLIEDHVNGLQLFNTISLPQFSEFPIGKIMKYIKENIMYSFKALHWFTKNDQRRFHDPILNILNDPNVEKIFQSTDNNLCLVPTILITIVNEILDLWIRMYTQNDIHSLTTNLLKAKSEINNLKSIISSLNKAVDEKTETLNTLYKELEGSKKFFLDKCDTINSRLLKLEKSSSSLLNKNNLLNSEKKKLSNEIENLKKQCETLEKINNEQNVAFRGVEKVLNIEKVEMEDKIKFLTDQYKKHEISFLKKKHKREVEKLQNFKKEAIEKLEKWNELPSDVFKRNSKKIEKNKKITRNYIDNVSAKIAILDNNYREKITAIKKGDETFVFDESDSYSPQPCPKSDLDYLLYLNKLEIQVCDGISCPPTKNLKHTTKLVENIKKQDSNQNCSNFTFNQSNPLNLENELNFKIPHHIDDILSNTNYPYNDNLVTITNESEYFNFNDPNLSDDFERIDYSFGDIQPLFYNNNEDIEQFSTVDDNNRFSYLSLFGQDYPQPDCVTNRNHLYTQAYSTCLLETCQYPRKSFVQCSNLFSCVNDNYNNQLLDKTPPDLSQTVSVDSCQPIHLDFINHCHKQNYPIQQDCHTDDNSAQDLQENSFATLLRAFSTESSSDSMW